MKLYRGKAFVQTEVTVISNDGEVAYFQSGEGKEFYFENNDDIAEAAATLLDTSISEDAEWRTLARELRKLALTENRAFIEKFPVGQKFLAALGEDAPKRSGNHGEGAIGEPTPITVKGESHV